MTDLAQLVALYMATEVLVAALVEEAAADGDRAALLAEALAALQALEEAATTAPALLEDVARAAAEEAAGAVVGPLAGAALAQEVGPVGLALEGGLLQASRTARVGTERAFPVVTPATVEESAREAVTGHVDALGRRTPLGPFARTRTTHAQRIARTAGLLDALPAGAMVRFSSHRTKHPACKPHEGNVYAVDEAPRPPLHPGCAHRLEPV